MVCLNPNPHVPFFCYNVFPLYSFIILYILLNIFWKAFSSRHFHLTFLLRHFHEETFREHFQSIFSGAFLPCSFNILAFSHHNSKILIHEVDLINAHAFSSTLGYDLVPLYYFNYIYFKVVLVTMHFHKGIFWGHFH